MTRTRCRCTTRAANAPLRRAPHAPNTSRITAAVSDTSNNVVVPHCMPATWTLSSPRVSATAKAEIPISVVASASPVATETAATSASIVRSTRVVSCCSSERRVVASDVNGSVPRSGFTRTMFSAR